jgi:ribonuclease P protein component
MAARRERPDAPIERLKRRAEFLAVAASRRRHAAPGLILQAKARRPDPSPEPDVNRRATAGRELPPAAAIRYGLTASRKVGGAVARNRARRRLREAARAVLPAHAAPGHDYVIVARPQTLERPFALLLGDLEGALRRLGMWRDGAP